jgi:hypothetical protein
VCFLERTQLLGVGNFTVSPNNLEVSLHRHVGFINT